MLGLNYASDDDEVPPSPPKRVASSDPAPPAISSSVLSTLPAPSSSLDTLDLPPAKKVKKEKATKDKPEEGAGKKKKKKKNVKLAVDLSFLGTGVGGGDDDEELEKELMTKKREREQAEADKEGLTGLAAMLPAPKRGKVKSEEEGMVFLASSGRGKAPKHEFEMRQGLRDEDEVEAQPASTESAPVISAAEALGEPQRVTVTQVETTTTIVSVEPPEAPPAKPGPTIISLGGKKAVKPLVADPEAADDDDDEEGDEGQFKTKVNIFAKAAVPSVPEVEQAASGKKEDGDDEPSTPLDDGRVRIKRAVFTFKNCKKEPVKFESSVDALARQRQEEKEREEEIAQQEAQYTEEERQQAWAEYYRRMEEYQAQQVATQQEQEWEQLRSQLGEAGLREMKAKDGAAASNIVDVSHSELTKVQWNEDGAMAHSQGCAQKVENRKGMSEPSRVHRNKHTLGYLKWHAAASTVQVAQRSASAANARTNRGMRYGW